MARHPRLALLSLIVLAAAACHDNTGPGVDLRYASIASGEQFSCALTRDGRAFCWGDDYYGQLGRAIPATYSLTPVMVSGGLRFTAISAGDTYACGLAADGTAWCWGLMAGGADSVLPGCNPALPALSYCSAAPLAVAGGSGRFAALAARGSCGVSSQATLLCWSGGVLRPLADPGQAYQAVGAGWYHHCGLTRGGDLRCWGESGSGQLGIDSSLVGAAASSPVASAQGHHWRQVTGGAYHTCAIDDHAAAWCWGGLYYRFGQLGNAADTAGTYLPVSVDGNLTWSALSAGDRHTCGVTGDGAAYCWGSDVDGRLGQGVAANAVCNGAEACATFPVAVVAADAPYAAISAGTWHTCAVTVSGSAWCWGRGSHGELGAGDTTSSRVPVQVLPADTTR